MKHATYVVELVRTRKSTRILQTAAAGWVGGSDECTDPSPWEQLKLDDERMTRPFDCKTWLFSPLREVGLDGLGP